MAKYKKLPVTIEAVQWTGQNYCEIKNFCDSGSYVFYCDDNLMISTLEGNMCASIGDFIIRGVDGEYYPCKPDIFKKTYEKVD